MRKILSCALAAPLLVSCAARSPSSAPTSVFCEQLAEVSVVTERLRNEGMPLADVTREADRLEQSKRFTEAEIAQIRDTIEKTFKSIRSPNEILLDCRMNSKK